MLALAEPRQNDFESHPFSGSIEKAREKLIIALDFSTIDEAREMVRTLGDEVGFYKVGLGLQLAGGDSFARELKKEGKRVFLDYKYYDIEETIRNAVARVAEAGIDFLTVHGVTPILKAAVDGRGSNTMKILCVTVLTSMDATDLQEMGGAPTLTVKEVVVNRARMALDVGIDGVIASPLEVQDIKKLTSDKLMVVTPGIRREWEPKHDQKRFGSPSYAIGAGADYLVIGRPITGAKNPKKAAHDTIREMAAALPTDAANIPSTVSKRDALGQPPSS
jgi:orotidine-5'-phosphate decarboxylase